MGALPRSPNGHGSQSWTKYSICSSHVGLLLLLCKGLGLEWSSQDSNLHFWSGQLLLAVPRHPAPSPL